MNTHRHLLLLLLSLSTLIPQFSTLTWAQGSLTPPPGVPAATMKTLDQVEARKPVQSLAAAAPYTISQPGSYYLTGNITVASGDAIVIASDDVSLDLNGFTIRSTLAGSFSGTAIKVSGAHSRLTVRHGSIVSGTTVPASGAPVKMGFAYGFAGTAGITQALVSEVHIIGIATDGINITSQGLVERCTARNCGGFGISADNIRDCSGDNCYNPGIYALENAVNCAGSSTESTGMYSAGNALNCTGTSTSGNAFSRGLSAFNASNCTGLSAKGTGLVCGGNANNCLGKSTAANGVGMQVGGTASFCMGDAGASVAIVAYNAIGCSAYGGGTVNATLKSLGTP